MDLDIGRLVLTAAIIFLPMYFFQKLADWSTANQKSIADLSVAFCNIVCYIRKSYCNYRREIRLVTNNEEFEKILENIDENGPEPQEEPERQYYFIKKARALVKKMSEELGRPLISSVTTFGCQMFPELETA